MVHRFESIIQRRWLGAFLLFLIALIGTATGQTPQAAKAEYTAVPMEVPDGFTVSAVGDIIMQHPQSMRRDCAPLMRILKSTDVTFGNFENTTFDLAAFKGYPQAESGGSWLLGTPDVPKDVRSMGFNLVSRANNHATDWGVEGMLETDRLLDLAGLVHAGTGLNRPAARQAAFLQTPRARVALVAVASSFTPMSRSMAPLGTAPGRPGLNALRTRRTVLITADQMNALRTIRDSMPKGSLPSNSAKGSDNNLELFGVRYRVGDHPGFIYEMDAIDLREILKSIRQGKQNSDFLILSMHAHDPGNWSQQPADFLPTLAHAAIDNGADMFIGHGPHQLRGIEIYKGKPIFYSLGNFFFHEDQQYPLVADIWEQFKVDPAASTEVEFSEQRRLEMFKDDEFYQGVIAVSRFERGQVAEIRLYPVDLTSARDSQRGAPRLAPPEAAQAILDRISKLSAAFGTTVEIKDKVGIIRLSLGKTPPKEKP
jgi:poly-gamma-glutamate synthesis protein (capsule biosynthesis protein)